MLDEQGRSVFASPLLLGDRELLHNEPNREVTIGGQRHESEDLGILTLEDF